MNLCIICMESDQSSVLRSRPCNFKCFPSRHIRACKEHKMKELKIFHKNADHLCMDSYTHLCSVAGVKLTFFIAP